MGPRSAWWRIFERPSLGGVLAGVAAWVVVVTALHVVVNHRGALTRGGEAAALQVGGLPVT
ncbi:MAG TPA: hypothetical protein VFO08_00150 [Methylomirabilota bacterium]|nr:hypothetical protein [Methylomirabilota bacterium]